MSGQHGMWTKIFPVSAVVALVAVGPGIGPVAAGPAARDAVSVFASAPAPGHPFGIAVGDGQVYVSTSAGDFFADPEHGGHLNSDDERVFTYDVDGDLVDTTVIDTADNSDMGLFGLALDGNPGPKHQLFVADMNGRILTVGLGQHAGPPKVFAQVPEDSGLAGDWMLSMWNDLAFDKAGNLYVPDDKPRIWKVTADGTARIWLTDPRLTGQFGFAGGPLGGRIDPTGQWLYVSITLSAEFPSRLDDLPDPSRRPSDGGRHRARPPFRRLARPDGRAAASDGPRVREIRQPVRQPAGPEPDRGPRSSWERAP